MGLLEQVAVYLAATALAVPLAKRLGFGSVLGYLFAGVAIGPLGLALIDDVENVLGFAEIGVVLLMFIIGLELQPRRLWVLRNLVFGLGSIQVLVTGTLLMLIGRLLGLAWPAALLAGFGLSLSSTAFVLQMLAERKALTTPFGRASFGVLLLQDLAVVPLIAALPAIAALGETDAAWRFDLPEFVRTIGIFVGLIVAGRYLLRGLLRFAASARLQEVFTAAALLLVVAAALATRGLGMSMALGAFLAGVLVADSPYRHQLETDIQPFKGLLLGLFFIAVGMSANLRLLVADPLGVLGLVVGLIAVKALVLALSARLAFALSLPQALTLGLVLGQGGEFGFVLFSLAAGDGLLGPELAERLILVVTLSMAATPLLYLAGTHLTRRLEADTRPFDAIDANDHDVVIAGFGRFGQIVARILAMQQIPFTALEASPAQVDFVRRFGNKIYYGDASRLDLLRTARLERARAFVLAVDDVESSVEIARAVREHYPELPIYARARNRRHAFALMDLGVTALIRDTWLSSIQLAGELLEGLGRSHEEADAATQLFRRHDEKTLREQHALHGDEQALIQSVKESAAQLKQLFEADARRREAARR